MAAAGQATRETKVEVVLAVVRSSSWIVRWVFISSEMKDN